MTFIIMVLVRLVLGNGGSKRLIGGSLREKGKYRNVVVVKVGFGIKRGFLFCFLFVCMIKESDLEERKMCDDVKEIGDNFWRDILGR